MTYWFSYKINNLPANLLLIYEPPNNLLSALLILVEETKQYNTSKLGNHNLYLEVYSSVALSFINDLAVFNLKLLNTKSTHLPGSFYILCGQQVKSPPLGTQGLYSAHSQQTFKKAFLT